MNAEALDVIVKVSIGCYALLVAFIWVADAILGGSDR